MKYPVTKAEIAAERTAFASVKLALVTASTITKATALPLYRGWWRIAGPGYECDVKASPCDLPEAVQLKLGHLGVQLVYGPRAKATKRAHASS